MEFFNGIGGDPYKPSLFELLAQEQLRDLLQPALKYVLSVFAQSHPRYLLRIVNRHEEFYAIVMFLVERHYLKTQNASFAENFYGLKRRRRPRFDAHRAGAAVGIIPEEEKLRKVDIRRSLFFLVGLPYLRAKAQDYYEAIGGGIDHDDLSLDGVEHEVNQSHSFFDKAKDTYKAAYPILNFGFELWLMACNTAYLFDHTEFYRPWLSWIGVDLRRLSSEDVRIQNTPPKPRLSLRSRTVLSTIRNLIVRSPRMLLDSLKIILPMAIFFVKFLEWWYSPSSPARSLSVSPAGPAIPPPALLPPHPQGLPVDKTKFGQCPICQGPIVNATALPSGYVFCYRCAHPYIEEHNRCPVTLTPVNIYELRKILV